MKFSTRTHRTCPTFRIRSNHAYASPLLRTRSNSASSADDFRSFDPANFPIPSSALHVVIFRLFVALAVTKYFSKGTVARPRFLRERGKTPERRTVSLDCTAQGDRNRHRNRCTRDVDESREVAPFDRTSIQSTFRFYSRPLR